MRKVLLALGIMALICSPAMAARNDNGAMVVHTNDAYTYSSQGVCTAPAGDPGTCEAAVTQSNKETGAVVWLLAAFLPTANPGVTVVYFGIRYDDACLDPGGAYKFCGPAGSLEVPDADWPYTGRGNSVAFGAPVVGDTLFPFYAFNIANFCGTQPGVYFGTGINPTGGYAAFVDDSNPPLLDYCYNFGEVHWFEPGFNNCPIEIQVQGACCFADGSCRVTLPGDCAQAGGSYQGDNTVCDPNPCPQPGACCFEDGTCRVTLPGECEQAGGHFLGGACDPNPCVQPGACCFGETCQVLSPDQCAAQGGVFNGAPSCDPNPCLIERAACCLNGNCTESTLDECNAMGGTWNQGIHCDDPGFQCPPVATESTTWGQIKATYR